MGWISVNDGLPPTNELGYGGEVFVYYEGFRREAIFQQGEFVVFEQRVDDPDEYEKVVIHPTHWMPVPEPPEGA